MIKIVNLEKKYNDKIVLKSINHKFPKKGLCIIYGPSGSGKTTLLNCIAGLLPYEGSIQIDNEYLEKLNDDQLSNLRLKRYGFVFQDFKLFETETVIANLLFPLETSFKLSKALKHRKCYDLLSLVGLNDKSKQVVNKLSGGEKQRVAIARALVNDPLVVLADEPTGALDEKNSIDILNILKIVSKRSLVIMVSHDQELTKRYADQIIEMEDGKISKILVNDHKEIKSNLALIKNGEALEKPHISDSFLYKHSLNKIKQKKIRTFICYSLTSLGLVGVGLAFSLSSSIATNIKKAYEEVMDDNSLIVSLNNKERTIKGQYAASYYEAEKIKSQYSDYISGVGVTYYINFEKFFCDTNSLVIVNQYRYCPILGFSARHINDFTWLEDVETKIYPEKIKELDNDEIIIGLNYQTLVDVCYELQIERTISSLGDYIKRNDLLMYFDLANFDWTYNDQQLVRVVGFTLENDLKIYHSNHLWNEYMFEEQMSFPSTDSISTNDNVPWMLKKIYYLKTKYDRDKCINLLYENKEMDNYIFEIADETYYPWLYYDTDLALIDRLLIFKNTTAHIPLWHINHILENDNNLKNPIIGSNGGYFIYPQSLMMGFSKTMYFSKDSDQLETIIDYQTSHSSTEYYQEELPKGVVSGNFANTLQNGVNFKIIDQNITKGNAADNLDEIVISSNLYKQLGLNDLNQTIYIATPKKQSLVGGNKIISDYVLISLNVVGVINSNKNIIYHNMLWPDLFYQCKIGISAYDLQCQNISFSLKDANKINDSLIATKKAFPEYETINPLSDINDSVDKVCFYVTIALIIFSSITTIIAVLLLTICNYLFILEERKEIALARCIGVSKSESKRFLYANSIVQTSLSLLIASIELIVVSAFANIEIGKSLSIGFSFSFNPISFIPMLLLAIIICLISSISLSGRINKINPIEALKA